MQGPPSRVAREAVGVMKEQEALVLALRYLADIVENPEGRDEEVPTALLAIRKLLNGMLESVGEMALDEMARKAGEESA